jgi:hypothetical protein
VYGIVDFVCDIGGVLELFIMIFGVLLYRVSEHSFKFRAIKALFLANSRSSDFLVKPRKVNKDGDTPKVYKNKKI